MIRHGGLRLLGVTPPTISSFTPTSGQVGIVVQINGANLLGATSVKFNGTSASFTVVSSIRIDTNVPVGATDGVIQVITPGGTVNSSGSFDVTVAPTGFDNTVTGNQPTGFTVPAGEVWKVSGLVTTPANVIVEGKLVGGPGDTLRFTGVNEANFVGGGMSPISSDVGLWVMGAGELDFQGTARVPWARATAGLSAGATSLTLDVAPTGWNVGNTICIVPTESTSVGARAYTGFEERTITSIAGSVIGFAALSHAHPSITLTGGQVMTPEVLNLSRDCKIEGTAGGRSHIFIRSTVPSLLKHMEVRFMGPRTASDFKILGRWAIHFHHAGLGSDGSLVEGVIVREAGSHAYVVHASQGVTFLKTISYLTEEEPYWWDHLVPEDDPHRVTYDSCVAAVAPGSISRHTAFLMGRGVGHIARKCVAIGLLGNGDSVNGFLWGEASGAGIWVFEDCVAHNNQAHGILNWHNNGAPHVIDRFIAYRNTRSGIHHGAYKNSFAFSNSNLSENGQAAVQSLALSRSDRQQRWTNMKFGGLFDCKEHTLPGDLGVLILDSTITGGVRIDDKGPEASKYDFVRCGLEAVNFTIVLFKAGGRIRVQRADGTAFQITPPNVVTPIAPFF